MSKLHLGQNFLKKPAPVSSAERRKSVERELINAESALGRTLFGDVKPGHTREFFCLRENVWLWYEDGLIIRYEVRQNGVFKRVGTNDFEKVTGPELQHFADATKAYLKLIKRSIYRD